MIELRDVTMSYGQDPVVNSVNLELPDRGITALVGPNGAGKSTLLCGIGRLLPLQDGQVIIDGKPTTDWDPKSLARRLAILRQENHLTVRLTVAELVALGRHPHGDGKLSDEDAASIARALECVSMSDLSHRFLDELSGGQRQRAFVAMTLAQETKYLLLDEPLSALDLKHSRDMMRHLDRVCKERDLSVVIVIHDLNTAAAYAQRLVAMKDGRIVAEGAVNEVMRADIIESVFDIEAQILDVEGRRVLVPRR